MLRTTAPVHDTAGLAEAGAHDAAGDDLRRREREAEVGRREDRRRGARLRREPLRRLDVGDPRAERLDHAPAARERAGSDRGRADHLDPERDRRRRRRAGRPRSTSASRRPSSSARRSCRARARRASSIRSGRSGSRGSRALRQVPRQREREPRREVRRAPADERREHGRDDDLRERRRSRSTASEPTAAIMAPSDRRRPAHGTTTTGC